SLARPSSLLLSPSSHDQSPASLNGYLATNSIPPPQREKVMPSLQLVTFGPLQPISSPRQAGRRRPTRQPIPLDLPRHSHRRRQHHLRLDRADALLKLLLLLHDLAVDRRD